MIRKAKLFFVRYRESLVVGMLLGVLVTQFWLLSNQSKTLTQVLDTNEQIKTQQEVDNAAREKSRQEAEERQERLVNYIDCLATLFIETQGEDADVKLQSLENCEYVTIDQNGRPVTVRVFPEQTLRPEIVEPRPPAHPPEPRQEDPDNPTELPPGLVDSLVEGITQPVDEVLDFLRGNR